MTTSPDPIALAHEYLAGVRGPNAPMPDVDVLARAVLELAAERDAETARANLEAAHHAHLRAERDALKAALVECATGYLLLVQVTSQHPNWEDDPEARRAAELLRIAEGGGDV